MKKSLKVLIIEDSSDDAHLLLYSLAKAGYKPSHALVQNAAGMRQQLGAQPWDLIISDYVIPGFGGLAALEVLKQSGFDIPFIIVSGKIGEDVAVESLIAGANDYLLKDRLTRLGPAIDRALKEAAQKRKRKQAEEALRESEERYRRLVESCPDGMFITTQSEMIFVNPAGVELLGASSPIELIGKPILEFVESNYRDLVEEHLRQALEGSDGPLLEHKMVRTDGAGILVETIARHIQYHGESAVQLLCRDVSSRKQMEQQLVNAQKMDAIARLAGGVANDFNNLFTVITGYGGLIRSGLDPDDPLQKDLQQIIQSTERAIGLTNQLLALSRKKAVAPESLDLNVVIDEVFSLISRLAGEKTECEFKREVDLGLVKADRGQVGTMIVNLALHARDAMPHGGKIVLETANLKTDRNISMSDVSLHPGEYVVLSISDTGLGLPDEEVQHVFEPFFGSAEPGRNTGLGLATVYAIVKQHGGQIFCASEMGKGSTFRIFLPRHHPVVVPPVSKTPVPEKEHSAVLVVEDEEVLREFAQLILRKNGYHVYAARDGVEALEVLREAAGNVDLVFTDVVMPRMSGAELSKRMQRTNPQIPVIFTSGYPRTILAEAGLQDRGLEFLQKPYTSQVLLNKIKDVLGSKKIS